MPAAVLLDLENPSRTIPDSLTPELYRKMLTAFYVEERMKIFVRQGKCPFYASAWGHEKFQIAMAMLLRPREDWFSPSTGRKLWPSA
jgi:TPP-dependent pyruvate/acetoin dehydrogenase alpha subunit